MPDSTTSKVAKPREYVAYYRVSTERQGRSGLGLEAQINSAQHLARQTGGEIIASFQEIETGKNNDRPQLKAALLLCRKRKAVLLIAKIDRLARNLAFIANLIESKAEFIACDNPYANKAQSQMMAVFAELESDAISTRTREAMAVAKSERGQTFGNPQPDTAKMTRQRVETTRKFRATAYPLIKQLRGQGMTLRAIADYLNEQGIKSQNKRLWHAEAVRLVLLRADDVAYQPNITAKEAA